MTTIYAQASAAGKAGVAVVRISGPLSFETGRALCGTIPAPQRSGLRTIRDASGAAIDQALVLSFQAGHSFTGDEVVELHLHGSPSIVRAVLRILGDRVGVRLAEPGEFTRRAMENGRLDLSQVEGLADLIDAETEAQRKQALRVLTGALGALAETWRQQVIRAAALLEATIDFVDEEVPVDVTPEVLELINNVRSNLKTEIDGVRISERIREGFEVAIIGPPNIGKSTLLNTLAGREAAITSEYAGTTRDVIEVRMELDGLPVTLLDTAGLRETEDQVESIGISRAVERANSADMRVFLLDETVDLPGLTPLHGDVVAYGKADLRGAEGFSISGKTGLGVDDLISKVSESLRQRAGGAGTAIRERHRLSMIGAVEALDNAEHEVLLGPDRTELAAEELRSAISALDSLVGRVDVEHILDEIFSSFCLGK